MIINTDARRLFFSKVNKTNVELESRAYLRRVGIRGIRGNEYSKYFCSCTHISSVCVSKKGPPVIRVNKYYFMFYFFAQYNQYKERYFF